MASDLLDYKTGGIRERADKIDTDVDVWFRDRWWDKTNLVATDYFLSNNLVDVAKQVNLKRAVCGRHEEIERRSDESIETRNREVSYLSKVVC